MMPFSTTHFATYIFAKPLTQQLAKFTFGPNAYHTNFAIANNKGRIGDRVFTSEARRLGPYLNINNTFDTEPVRPVAAASRLWWIWRRCWSSSAPWKLRLLVFKHIGVSTLFSSVVAFALETKHYRTMHTLV